MSISIWASIYANAGLLGLGCASSNCNSNNFFMLSGMLSSSRLMCFPPRLVCHIYFNMHVLFHPLTFSAFCNRLPWLITWNGTYWFYSSGCGRVTALLISFRPIITETLKCIECNIEMCVCGAPGLGCQTSHSVGLLRTAPWPLCVISYLAAV